MFRSNFPDSPNLFANLRRPYRPQLGVELRRNKLTSTIGLVLVIVGIILVVYVERKAVKTARSLDEGQQKVLVPETIDVVFEENNGKLVLITGPLTVEDALEESVYGISVRAVKLKKQVQVYQWYETADKRDVPEVIHEGDHDNHVKTTYSYGKEWFDSRTDSEAFENTMGHHNPEDWPYNSSLVVNQRVKIGGFLLCHQLKLKFRDYVTFTSDERPEKPDIKMHAGIYYHANDVWQPEVGDSRVHFSYAGKDGELMTVVGKQSGREIRPFETESGEELLFLHSGLRKPEEVFHHEHSQNRLQTWLYRLLSWFLMFLGYNCVSNILDIIVDDSPRIRRVLILGVTSLPFSFSMSSTLLFIGIGWVLYRPLIGIVLLFIATAPFLLAFHRIQQQRELEWRRSL